MKITYLTEWSPYKTSGVLQKIESQTTQWINNGHEVQLIFVYGDEPTLKNLIKVPFEYYRSFISSINIHSEARKFINRMLVAKQVEASVKLFNPDVIYYRQSVYYPRLNRILSIAPAIVEVNTNDIDEIKLFSKSKQIVYNWGRKRLIKLASAFVCVTDEIETIYKLYNKPTITIANGIETSLYKSIVKQKDRDDIINLIFVGSPNQPWHGLDKVKEMARTFPEYHFHIVGPESEMNVSINTTFYGYLNKEDLMLLYRKMDFGIGTLALHRNNMQEACPLKTREYLLLGLPVILAYKDIDVYKEDFILELPNTEDNVNPNKAKINAFIKQWQFKEIDKRSICKRLSYEYKELKRLQFFQEILGS